jgi:hypothetical protein
MNRTKLFKQIYKSAQSSNPPASPPPAVNTTGQPSPAQPSPSPPAQPSASTPPTPDQNDKSKGFDVMGTLREAYNYVHGGYGSLKGNIRDALKNVVSEETANVISQWGTPALLGLLFALGYKLLFDPNKKNWFSVGVLGALAGVGVEALAYFLGGGFGKKEDKSGAGAAATGGQTPPPTPPAAGVQTPPSTPPAAGGSTGQAAGGAGGP